MSYMKKRNEIMMWGAVIIWMGLIFYLSHQPASTSGQLSAGITNVTLNIIGAIFPIEIEKSFFHFIIRKGAHFFAYLILGILVIHALRKSPIKIRLALIFCIIYAISDEVHQLFIPGRSGELRDVLIDSVGAVVGIGIYSIIRKAKDFRNKYR